MSGSENEHRAASDFRLWRVLALVLPAFVLAAAAVVFFGFYDGLARLQALMRPPLVPATGKVLYNGKPLANARIFTQPLRPGLRGSIAFTDDDGSFTLQYDNQGKWADGAYVGEHKVTVAGYGPQPPAGAPPLLTPPEYESFDTTPLRIHVTRDPKQNVFTLELSGEPGGQRPMAGGPGAGGRGGGGPAAPPGGGFGRGRLGGREGPPGPLPEGAPRPAGPGGGFVSPETMVEKGMESFDKDGDAKLNADELREAIGIFGEVLRNADANKDGFVDAEEMLHALTAGRPAAGASPTPDAPSSAPEPAPGAEKQSQGANPPANNPPNPTELRQ